MTPLLRILLRNCDFGNFDEFDLAVQLHEWELIPLYRGGGLVGVVMRKGSEIHVAIDAEHRVKSWRDELRKIIRETRLAHGSVTTKTIRESSAKFVTRLGFVEIGRLNGCVSYKLPTGGKYE